ncbi:MAG: hypothetical protein KY453_10320 [Gemmatimonadetes bacterium]|nr:hypothetical protein [Gemmatimonadota bacterium]
MAKNTQDDGRPGAGEQGGEAVGGITGSLVGAGVGAAAGPVGAVIGGIAGAVGGWWAGEKAGKALDDWTEGDLEAYRDHFETYDAHAPLITTYDQAHPGYVVGHMAARNPDYKGRPFDDIEEELMHGWEDDEYEIMRPYVRHGYGRGHKRI